MSINNYHQTTTSDRHL